MNDDQTLWERACEKAGVWKRERCEDIKGAVATYFPYTCRHGMLGGKHDIPAPAIGDAGATVKMLEWLASKYGDGLMIDREREQWWVNCKHHSSDLWRALAAAVLEVKV